MAHDIHVLKQFMPILMEKNVREFYFYGGRGGGRSTNSAILLLNKALLLWSQTRQPVSIACLRSFQNSLRDSYLKELKTALEFHPYLREHFHYTAQSFNGKTAPINFIFKGLNHNASEIKSLSGIDIAVVEEADGITQEALDYLIPTIRKEGSQIIFLFNPSLKTTPIAQRMIKLIGGEENLYKNHLEEHYDAENKRYFYVRSVFSSYRENIYLSPTAQQAIEMDRKTMDEEDFNCIYLGQFRETLKGTYYQKEIANLYFDRRIKPLTLDYNSVYYALFDLGLNDLTVAWIVQRVGDYWHFIDCLSYQGTTFRDVLEDMGMRGYVRPHLILPHDGQQARGYTTLDTPEKIGRALGLSVRVIPVTKSVLNDINATKQLFGKFIFNQNKNIEYALNEIKQYGPKITAGLPTNKPDHAHSDFADPLRMVPYLHGSEISQNLDFSALTQKRRPLI